MIRINLLPVREAKKRNTAIVQMSLMVGAVFVALVACYAWAWFYDVRIEEQQAKIQENKDNIARLNKIIGEVKDLGDQKKRLNDQLGVISKLERGKRGPVHVLDELSKHIPKRVWITEFDENRQKLKLTGVGLENSDISEFLRALQKSKYFKDVRLGFTQSETRNSVTIFKFSIEATVDYAA